MPTNSNTSAPRKQTKRQLEDQVSMLNDALEAALSLSPETDNNFFPNGLSGSYTDRTSWDRKKIFAEALRAWRVNPIARRIVKLMTSFVIGKGLAIKSDKPQVQTFLDEWWKKNKITRNAKRWKDEDTRTGNLFPLFNVLENKMTIIRMVPAEQINDIITTENDIEQELGYFKDDSQTEKWDAYQPNTEQTLFMRHYASNQPIGSAWGEADLSPLLVWIGRYSSWLEDRVRLNRFRTAFMYVIKGAFASEIERSKREKDLNANPPKSGSTLVLNSNNGEDWGILSAQLDSFDASVDGLTIKKMIGTGVGFPMHWLAEPEGGTQTTAEAAGTPTFRTMEETQTEFFENIVDMATVACEVRGLPPSIISIEGPDITERDNATLALALGRAYPQLADLFDRDAIDEKEFMRLVYKTFAEVWTGKTPTIQKKPLIKPDAAPANPTITDSKTDPGDPKEEESSNQTGNGWDAKLQDFLTSLPMRTPTINITNQIPEQEAPSVSVTNQVDVPSVTVTNQIPEQAAPIVSVQNQIETPIVNINVPEQETPFVQVNNQIPVPVINIENQIETPKPQEKTLQTEPALPKRKKRK